MYLSKHLNILSHWWSVRFCFNKSLKAMHYKSTWIRFPTDDLSNWGGQGQWLLAMVGQKCTHCFWSAAFQLHLLLAVNKKIPWIHPHLFIWGCLPAYDCWQITELGSLGSMRPLRTPEDAILRHGKVWIWAPVKFVPPRNKHQICVKTPKISVKGLTTSIHFYLPAPKLGYFQPPSFVCLQRKFLVLAW